jgi:hypothetical protein
MQTDVSRSARLSRYIFTRNHLNPGQRFRAFLPPPDLKLSVFETEQLAEAAVWQVAQDECKDRPQTLFGRADIISGKVYNVGLSVARAEPPPKHRHIEGWPPFEQKQDQKALAMTLGNDATIVALPS